jgi:uncharacterized protein (TIGR03083 family)
LWGWLFDVHQRIVRAMTLPARDVLEVYLGGVRAFEYIASRMPDDDWERPTPCTEWTASDLVGHVLCVAEDYNAFLDSVIEGHDQPLRLSDDLALHNAARLAQLRPEPPLVRLAAFGLSARRFAYRVSSVWDEALYHLYGRPWTVGNHAGLCAVEWHIHTWDLACSTGLTYRPVSLAALTAVWRQGLPHLTLPAGDEWAALLFSSGRELDPAIGVDGGRVH